MCESVRASGPFLRDHPEGEGRDVILSDRYGDLLKPDGTPASVEPRLENGIRNAVGLALESPDVTAPGGVLVDIAVRSAEGRTGIRVLAPVEGCDLLPVLIQHPTASRSDGDLGRHGLTPRQADVMALIMCAETNAGIANKLGISPKTVEKHIEAAYRRLGVQTRTEALLILLKEPTAA